MLCSRVQNLLSAYCDRELSGAEMLRIRNHLSACPECRREHEAIGQVKGILGALPPAEPSSAFRMDSIHADQARDREPLWLRKARSYWAFACQPVKFSLAGLRSDLERSSGRVAIAGLLAVTLLTAVVVRQPQHSDAVSAHVPPEAVAPGDTSPLAEMPETALLPPGLRGGYLHVGGSWGGPVPAGRAVYFPGAPAAAPAYWVTPYYVPGR